MKQQLAVVLACLFAGTLCAQVTFTANPNVAIPDNNAFGVTSTINVPATADRIYSLRAGIRIDHTYDADLSVWLLPPGVTWAGPYATVNNGAVVTPPAGAIELSTKNGGANNNYGTGTGGGIIYTNFKSTLDPITPPTQAITAGAAPFTSQTRWSPEGLAQWNLLFGSNPSGNWTLIVADGWGIDTGTLISWQLEYVPPPAGVLLVGRGAANVSGATLRTGTIDQVAGQVEFQAGSAINLTSVTLQAENGVLNSGSFSRVALHEDVNGNGQLDVGDGAVFNGTVAASANITLTAGPAVAFAAGQTRTYLIVVDTLATPAVAGVAYQIAAAASVNSTGAEFGSFPLQFGYRRFGPPHSWASAPIGGRTIQDNYGPGVTDTISVPATLDTIGSLRVGIRINHQTLQDVDVYLIPPGVSWAGPYIIGGAPPAGVIALTQDEGANGNDYGTGAANGPYVYTQFSSNIDPVVPGTVQITAGGQNAPFTAVPVYRPIGEAAWNTLYGTNPSGDWTLVAVDDAGGTAGTLVSWYLEYIAHPRAVLAGNPDMGNSNVGVPAPGSPQVFTLSNDGELPLTVTAINFVGGEAADFALSGIAFPANIPGGSSVNFGVTFTPSASGLRATDMEIVSNDGGVPNSVLPLNIFGQGVLGNVLRIYPGTTNQPGEAFQYGTAGVVLGQYAVEAGASPVTITDLTFRDEMDRTLTANLAGISLYYDANADGELDGGDVLIAAGSMAGGAASFSFMRVVAATIENWILVADVMAAPADTALAMEIRTVGDVVATLVPTATFPVRTGPHPLNPVRVFTTTPPGGIPIPNNSTVGITSTIVIPPTAEIVAALRVGVRINHTRAGDIEMWLLPPGVAWAGPYFGAGPAGAIELSTDNGGNGDDFGTGAVAPYVYANFTRAIDPVFTPSVNVTGGAAPFTSSFWRPEDQGADLNNRYGVSPSGTWTLVIADDQGGGAQGGNAGTLLSWQIEYVPPAVPTVTGINNWGATLVGQPSALNSQPYMISNIGGVDMGVTAISLIGANSADWSFAGPTGAPVSVISGATHNVALNFTPGALGPRNAALRITYGNGLAAGLTFDHPLTGTGISNVGVLTTPPGPIDYGQSNPTLISSLSPVTHTVTNTGAAPLTITQVQFAGSHPGDWTDVSGLVFPVVIGAGLAQNFQFQMQPGAVGARDAIIRFISDTGGVPNTPTDVAVFGLGTAGVLSTPLGPVDYGTANPTILSSLSPVTHTVNNTGNGPLTITQVQLAGTNPGDWTDISAVVYPVVIGAGLSQNFQFEMRPGAAGPRSAIIRFLSDSGAVPNTPTDVSVTGTGTVGTLTSATPVNYGSTNLNVPSATIIHTINNTGSGPLTITAAGFIGGDSAMWSFNPAPTFPIVVAAGLNTTISARFTPTAMGARTTTLRLTSDTGGTPGTFTNITCDGNGTAGQIFIQAPGTGPVNYGGANPGTSAPALVHTIQNTGTGPLTISGIALTGHTGDWGFAGMPVAYPVTLAPLATLPITGTFTPTALGARAMDIEITSDSGSTPPPVVTVIMLAGQGTRGLVNVITGTGPIDYGPANVGSPSPLNPINHTIRNDGDGPLSISGIALTGHTADWNITGLPVVFPHLLLPTQTLVLGGNFTPTALGVRNMAIEVTSDSGGFPPPTLTVINLEGEGTQGQIDTNLGPHDYGASTLGLPSANSPLPHQVDNIGSGPLTITSISLTGANIADWNFTPPLPATPFVIPAGGFIQFDGELVASTTGPLSGRITFESNSLNLPGTLTHIDLVGNGTSATTCSVLAVGPDNGGPVAVTGLVTTGLAGPVNVAVTYTGGSNPGPARLSSAGGLTIVGNVIQGVPVNAPFSFEWDAYATERHTTAANYVLTLTPMPSGAPGASAAFALTRDGGWAQHVTPGGQATGVYSHTMIFDELNDRIVVFGGRRDGAKLNSVWVYERSGGQTAGWRILSPAGALPPERQYSNAIYDATNQRMVIFGGAGTSATLDDTWSLSLVRGAEAWTQLSLASPFTPAARRSAAFVHDAARNRAILFGGVGAVQYNDTWAIDLDPISPTYGFWSQLTPGGTAPTARFGHAAVADFTGDRMVIVGGRSGTSDLIDVHEFSFAGAGTWSTLAPGGTLPLGRYYMTYSWDGTNRGLILQSGYRGSSTLRDTWQLSLAGAPVWAALATDPDAGVGRVVGGGAWDPARDEVLFYGGINPSALNTPRISVLDVSGAPAWQDSVGTTADSAGPEGRWGAVAGFDTSNDRVVLWGGKDHVAYYGGIWALDRSAPNGEWARVIGGGAAPAAAVYSARATDLAGNRMFIHGGNIASGGRTSELWSLNLATGAWTQWPGVGPAARDQHSMIYDSIRNRVLVYGGRTPGIVGDVWAYDLGAMSWSLVTPLAGPAPVARYAHGAAYDSTNDRMVIVAGRSSTTTLNDVWVLSLNPGTETWTNRSALFAPIPSGRHSFACSSNGAGTQIWLHGGDTGTPNAELWEANVGGAFTTWTQLSFLGSAPLARSLHTACSNGADFYAGTGFLDARGASDFWQIDTSNSLAGWTKVGTSTPTSIVTSASAYDPVARRMIAFGGLGGGVHNADLWQLDLSSPVAQWAPLSATGPGPSARRAATMVYDDSPAIPRMVMYGGRLDYSASSIVDELWALVLDPGNEHWVQLNPTFTQYPGARTNHRAVVDSADRMIVFGGQTPAATRTNDVFVLDLLTLDWTQMTPGGTAPSERFSGAWAFDAPRNRVILHGGNTGGVNPLSDAFTLDLAGSGTWAPLAGAGTAPGALYYHSAVVDPASQRLLIFGGYSTGAEARLFALNLVTDTWTGQTGTVAHPQARWAHSACWDVDRMVIAGGYFDGEISATQQNGTVADTWFWGD
ncbi:MAG: choice-of-anchor D domain-containing protein [Planctomycetes bacterium]|nr:choice-of-anchor D domain-containing protein [Planctomycetota bacterium]